MAMKACPYRADFYTKLAADPAGGTPASAEKVDEAMSKWLGGLASQVEILKEYYATKGLNV
jgi:hypothetical protein